MSSFHDFVRGISNEVPSGYSEAGMHLYRHLVYLGVVQMLECRRKFSEDALFVLDEENCTNSASRNWSSNLQFLISFPWPGVLPNEPTELIQT